MLSRTYWAERGVIPRWQLLGVYALIVTAGAIGFQRTGDASDQAKRAAAQSRHVAVETRHLAERTNAALCTFRADVKRRLDNGEAFLHNNPQGIPGVPNAFLRQSFDAQRRTVKALRGLDCSP